MNELFISRLDAYYVSYYKDMLGLKDYEDRCLLRRNEVELIGKRTISLVNQIANVDIVAGRTLVVGCGSGAELGALAQGGGDPYGIDPVHDAVQLSRDRLVLSGVTETDATSHVKQAGAEKIPWDSDFFDFVICHTVLEHVQDVPQSLKEMIRVTRRGGKVFLCLPDYRFPWEGHYKMWLPLMMPRWVIRKCLSLQKRPVEFLDSLNFLTAPQLDRVLYKLQVKFSRYVVPERHRNFLIEAYRSIRNIHPTQYIILHV